MTFIGKYSFGIYLIHVMLLNTSKRCGFTVKRMAFGVPDYSGYNHPFVSVFTMAGKIDKLLEIVKWRDSVTNT